MLHRTHYGRPVAAVRNCWPTITKRERRNLVCISVKRRRDSFNRQLNPVPFLRLNRRFDMALPMCYCDKRRKSPFTFSSFNSRKRFRLFLFS